MFAERIIPRVLADGITVYNNRVYGSRLIQICNNNNDDDDGGRVARGMFAGSGDLARAHDV